MFMGNLENLFFLHLYCKCNTKNKLTHLISLTFELSLSFHFNYGMKIIFYTQ